MTQPRAPESWLGRRWRQLRSPPPPVLRAVLANLAVAVLGGAALFAYSRLDPGAMLAPPIVVYVAIVIFTGSALTYLWVDVPSDRSGVRRRSPWIALLGFFASVPIAYLVLVVVFQMLP